MLTLGVLMKTSEERFFLLAAARIDPGQNALQLNKAVGDAISATTKEMLNIKFLQSMQLTTGKNKVQTKCKEGTKKRAPGEIQRKAP